MQIMACWVLVCTVHVLTSRMPSDMLPLHVMLYTKEELIGQGGKDPLLPDIATETL